MNRLIFTLGFLMIFVPVSYAQQHRVTFTSMLPVPSGNYVKVQTKQLKLNAQPDGITCDTSMTGLIYLSSITGEIKVCSNSNWKTLDTWTSLPGSIVYLSKSDTDAAMKVGIGTKTPKAKLHLTQDGSILAEGVFSAGAGVPTTGAGTRLMWYPAKAAFRVGSLDSTCANCWDEANVGPYSMALGWNNKVIADRSTIAGGSQNTISNGTASGIASGYGNQINVAYDGHSFIGGGHSNIVESWQSVLVGGYNNHIFANGGTAIDGRSFIGGGILNEVHGRQASVVGGWGNIANGALDAIVGGFDNKTSGNYSFIGGGEANVASGSHSFVGGGGNSDVTHAPGNIASSDWSAIAGGLKNTASATESFVGSGESNVAKGKTSGVATGLNNQANALQSFVGGGTGNIVDTLLDNGGARGFIGGGDSNHAVGNEAAIAGGYHNYAHANSFVGGGADNKAGGDGGYNVVGGGQDNEAGTGPVDGTPPDPGFAFVGGGKGNIASGRFATIGGGGTDNPADGNIASGPQSFIGGGARNIASGWVDVVGGGNWNTASGGHSVVPGGYHNTAAGDTSFAAGSYMNVTGDNTFAWGISDSVVDIPTSDVFIIYSGDVGIGKIDPAAKLDVNGCVLGANLPNCASDERLKKNVEPLTGALDKILKLRGVSYEWIDPTKHSNQTGRQTGFIAQELEKVFPEWVYTNEQGYKAINYNGFDATLVEAIKELKMEMDDLKTENAALKARVAELEKK